MRTFITVKRNKMSKLSGQRLNLTSSMSYRLAKRVVIVNATKGGVKYLLNLRSADHIVNVACCILES